MTSDKQIVEIDWQAGKKAIGLAIIAALICGIVPRFFDENYACSIQLFLPAQFLAIALIISFFYSDVSRLSRLKAAFSLIACVSLLGIVANLSDQAFIMLGQSTILFDVVALPLVYVCATLTLLAFGRLKKVVVERKDPKEPARPNIWQTIALNINPWVMAGLIFSIATAIGFFPPDYRTDRSFAVTFIFFFWIQMGTVYILTNMFFPEAKGNERFRVYYTILSLALIIGALANLDHDQITTRVGNRIDINTVTFVIMNLGAILTVSGFHNWNSYLSELKEKFGSLHTAKEHSKGTQ